MKKGFTLVELLIVVVIIGILSSIGIVNYIRLVNNAREASLKNNMHILHTVVEIFSVTSLGQYPGGIDTKVKDVNPSLVSHPDGEKSIADGRRKPPFSQNALLLPHESFKNPFFPDENALDNLFSGPPPVPPIGCVYYTGFKEDGNIATEGEVASKYVITAYGLKGPLDLILP
ncbi:MAG: prepilin-type N-terminal cleavage/methylation domain-containing protein [candidate division WOR-3 bacterium]